VRFADAGPGDIAPTMSETTEHPLDPSQTRTIEPDADETSDDEPSRDEGEDAQEVDRDG